MNSLSEIRQIRLQKLQKIRQAGIDPYPPKYESRQIIADIRKQKLDTDAKVAGRIISWREHGGSIFADLVDESGKIQIYFKSDELESQKSKVNPFDKLRVDAEQSRSIKSQKSKFSIETSNNFSGNSNFDKFSFLNNLDIGDIIGVNGKLFKTKMGELTVLVSDYQLLTKSLRPLPSSWFGFKDVEERYRKRYLDLIANEKIKEIFQIRSQVISLIRKFLDKRGYIEVETPILQPLYGGGLARPFKTYHNALDISLYLRISTELYLKRLIVGGFEKVYEINKVFRNEGIDRNHNPEFTILETMEAYADYQDNMNLTEEMFEYIVKEIFGKTEIEYQGQKINFKRPWKRIKMMEAIKQETGKDLDRFYLHQNLPKLLKIVEENKVELRPYEKESAGLILNAIFEQKVQPKLIQPTFVYDYPFGTSPLAKRCADNPSFVERFEHFILGMEMSNNYSELNDPLDLVERFKDERKKERLGDEEAHQFDQDFIEALEYGMPPTSGLGPGIDRFVMIVTNQKSLREVILFPTMKPRDHDRL